MKTYFYLILALYLFAACKKTDVTPGSGQEAYLNFYNGSELLQQNLSLSMNNLILINDSLQGQVQPQFSPTDDFRQFPFNLTGSSVMDAIVLPRGATYDVVYWMVVAADQYRIAYTSINNTAIADTSIQVSPKTFTTQYLVESPQSNDAYRVLTIPAQRGGSSDKVRVQIINLSPDFGPLEVFRADHSGNRVTTALTSVLGVQDYSAYIELDTAGVSTTYNKIILKFSKSSSNAVVLTKAIDAVPGSCYSIVFQGSNAPRPEQSEQATMKPGGSPCNLTFG